MSASEGVRLSHVVEAEARPFLIFESAFLVRGPGTVQLLRVKECVYVRRTDLRPVPLTEVFADVISIASWMCLICGQDEQSNVSVPAEGDISATQPRPRVKGSAFQRVVSNKGKKMLMSAEMGQLTAVLNATEFQQDPFAAIQAHLRQTACPALPVDDKARRPGVSTKKVKVGQHSTKRGGREDKKPTAKPYKGRNAKMRTKF